MSGKELSLGDSSSFLLSKWYLDCVASDGSGVIVYAADLRWRAVHVRYANTLRFSGETVKCATSVRDYTLPKSEKGQIALQIAHLGLEGVWLGSVPPIEVTVFETGAGAVRWHCLQPASRARVRLDGAPELTGLGYAELLQLSIPPWKLPLNELHWGRFVADSDALVWIDWRGPHSHQILVHNGAKLETGIVTESAISSHNSNVHLALDRHLVLRSGILGDTVFPGLARLAAVLPGSMFRVRETKWLSRGTLRHAKRTVSGWAVHEVVKWSGE